MPLRPAPPSPETTPISLHQLCPVPTSCSLLPSAGAQIPRVKSGLSLSLSLSFHIIYSFNSVGMPATAFPTLHVPYNLSLKSVKSEFLSQSFVTNPRPGIKVDLPFSNTWKYFWFKTQKSTAIQVQTNVVPRHSYAGTDTNHSQTCSRSRWSASRSYRLTPGNHPVPNVKETGLASGVRSERHGKPLPPGFDPRNALPIASRYTD